MRQQSPKLAKFRHISLVFLAFVWGCNTAPPIPAPTSFENWDGGSTFQIDYPKEWTSEGGGRGPAKPPR